LNVVVHPANIQDRDGGLLVLKAVRRLFPFIERIFADGGYQGEATAAAVRALGPWQLEIVKRSDHTVGFEVLPQRWIVERTFAWLGRCPRLAKDFEATSAVAWAFVAHVRTLTGDSQEIQVICNHYESDTKNTSGSKRLQFRINTPKELTNSSD
jgi:transposase